jgi:hypothetical protein
MLGRREWLAGGAALAAGLGAAGGDGAMAQTGQTVPGAGLPPAQPLATPPAQPWQAGPVLHILPTVGHDRFMVKLSLREPAPIGLRLFADNRRIWGRATDSAAETWQFAAEGLEPGRRYLLHLTDAAGRPLCDPWPLSTFPALSDQPRSLRVLFFTCAGGHDLLGRQLPMAIRTRLLDRALSFAPQAVVANGDHVYWDLRSRARSAYGEHPRAIAEVGRFRREARVLDGGPNEAVLKRATGPQIVPLYANRLRSIPAFFLQDDHDHFDNDEADDRLVTFPPDPFQVAAATATQRLYYPEFLPDPNRPLGLGSTGPWGIAQSYGTLRYGRLLEVLLYDCRRWMTLAGPSAGFLPDTTEAWLAARMAETGIAHVVNAPSTPPGWSAGKWAEWYADVEVGGGLTTERAKPYWQSGWRAQHDRLLAAASAMRDRVPLFISGDLHAIGETRIRAIGAADLARNPVVAVLPGPLGTAQEGWPSTFRGMAPKTPAGLTVDEQLPALEENGFVLADFTPEDVTLRYFRWRREAPEAIDGLQPFRTTRLARGAAG